MPPMQVQSRLRSRLAVVLAAFALLASSSSTTLAAQSLKGSRTAMVRQNRAAKAHDYTFLRTSSQVHDFARRGLLLKLSGNRDYELNRVSFPYARPEVKTFIERLADQYRGACGERLVVTSLTRPTSRQPWNASDMSVHPTGMAVDLRRSSKSSCRVWLERTLLQLEKNGVLDATRENHPPHYHVALYPKPYLRYLASRGVAAGETRLAAATGEDGATGATKYRVASGDNLWVIARRHGTSVEQIKQANGIRSNRLKPGQVLDIPVAK
jgi:hypothetical protein